MKIPQHTDLTFLPCLDADRVELINFLTTDEWPFFGNPRLTAETVSRWLEEGFFNSADSQSYWIMQKGTRVGHIRIFDLEDPTPLFDIRIATDWRGKGIGRSALLWLIAHCFQTWPRFLRLEAQTRRDNRPMRRVLELCGFVKEAHYREAWPDAQGVHHDGVGYAILRRDWESGNTTPVEWQD